MHRSKHFFFKLKSGVTIQQRAGSPWSPLGRWRVVSPAEKTFVLTDDTKIPHDVVVDIQLSRSLFGFHSDFFVSYGLARITRAVVLPVGYPNSVSPSYLGFVKYSVAQVSLIALTRILSTQAMLLAVGIGQSGVLPIAAVINWVLKDGLGHLGSIIVGTRVNTKFDSDPKRFKFMSVYLGQGANLLGILSLVHPPIFLLLTTLGSTLSRIATLSFTSSRARIYENFSRAGNLGDLIRCSQAQSTLATMAGTTVAVILAPIIGANVLSILAVFFPASIACHYFAYKSVCLIELTTLNRPRAESVIHTFITTGRVPTCGETAKNEKFIGTSTLYYPNLLVNPPIGLETCMVDNLVDNLSSNKYALYNNHLFISSEAKPEDALKGFFIACTRDESLWEQFRNGLDNSGWKMDVVFIDQVDQRLVINRD